jgi:DNA-binding NarL/FixJ family response regulator
LFFRLDEACAIGDADCQGHIEASREMGCPDAGHFLRFSIKRIKGRNDISGEKRSWVPGPPRTALLHSNWGVIMFATRSPAPVYIGLVSDEPLRLEGLLSIFDQPTGDGHAPLIPVTGSMAEMLARATLEYLVIDMYASSGGLAVLDTIRRARPSLRLIVIGPEGNDELVLESIVAGARAYLDLNADTDMVRQAIEVVTSGSIWAPRRLLSKLIDRLLKIPDSSLTNAAPRLTAREKEVLDLILQARSNREIARQLGIEERTVKAHVGRLMRKTGADNRIQLSMRTLNRPAAPQKPSRETEDDPRGIAGESARTHS